jgi:hypothetical protein
MELYNHQSPQKQREWLELGWCSLAKAMKEGREVYIAYANHNPNEKQARKVKPLQWMRYGEAFKAFCFIDNMEKTFNTHKILRIEDHVWSVTPEGISSYLLFLIDHVIVTPTSTPSASVKIG